jgi:hypothetical protein
MCNGLCKSLKRKKNGAHWEDLVPYNRQDLIEHLEKQFTEGMSWDNYGLNGWTIDHIIPRTAFHFINYTDLDFSRCWALSNLRPLWHKENMEKSDKIIKPFQPSLDLQLKKNVALEPI